MKQQKHGLSQHPAYKLWGSIKNRCHNPNNYSYGRYGGRGIRMCEEWIEDPQAFVAWALANGYERGLQIDRINNSEGYSPDNCRFVQSSINQQNKRGRSNTGIKNVYRRRGNKFRVIKCIDGRNHDLGSFDTLEEAAKVAETVRVIHGKDGC